LNNPQKPMLNRAYQSSYPPASTFKTILTAFHSGRGLHFHG
jgi:cell division protein FtsI/penicillin-binding protein 2